MTQGSEDIIKGRFRIALLGNSGSFYFKEVASRLTKRLGPVDFVNITKPDSSRTLVTSLTSIHKRSLAQCLRVVRSRVVDPKWKDVLRVDDYNSEVACQELSTCDIAICYNTGLLKRELIHSPERGTFIAHPSLLPKYRGLHATHQAVLAGDYQGLGVTFLRLWSGIDTGPIVVQRPVDLRGLHCLQNTSDVYLFGYIDVTVDGVVGLLVGDVVPKKQRTTHTLRPIDNDERLKAKGLMIDYLVKRTVSSRSAVNVARKLFLETDPRRWWGDYVDVRAYVASRISALRGCRILDVGSSVGAVSLNAPTDATVHGVDIDGDALRLGATALPNLARVEGSMFDLPLQGSSYDRVVLAHALPFHDFRVPHNERMRLRSTALIELFRVLKPGGHLLLSSPNGECAVYAGRNKIKHSELVGLLEETGFHILEDFGWNCFPMPLMFLPKKLISMLPDKVRFIMSGLPSRLQFLVPGIFVFAERMLQVPVPRRLFKSHFITAMKPTGGNTELSGSGTQPAEES